MRAVTLVHRGNSSTVPSVPLVGPRGIVHQVILAAVWVAFAISGLVFTEPAPVDALLIVLAVVLPAAGLVVIPPALGVYIAFWSVAASGGFIAATLSRDSAASALFTTISVYLYGMSFILAGFIARSPLAHGKLVLSGWLFAAVITAIVAIVGYFDLVPGAYDLFTKFDRAAGTFKDPNVFGPFLVAPMLYALHLVLQRTWRGSLLPALAIGVMALGVLLSFSRGAWINLVVALALYGFLSVLVAQTGRERATILRLVFGGVALLAVVAIVIVQDDRIGTFVKERASPTQSYDEGPAGRFGGQEKAKKLILENPLGIGAGQFTSVYHTEEVHNVYLSTFLNAGWVGGLIYALMTGLTVAIGLRQILRSTPARPLLVIALSAFAATAAEGIVIDIDHWRNVYVLMALVWGMSFATTPMPGDDGVRRRFAVDRTLKPRHKGSLIGA